MSGPLGKKAARTRQPTKRERLEQLLAQVGKPYPCPSCGTQAFLLSSLQSYYVPCPRCGAVVVERR